MLKTGLPTRCLMKTAAAGLATCSKLGQIAWDTHKELRWKNENNSSCHQSKTIYHAICQFSCIYERNLPNAYVNTDAFCIKKVTKNVFF